MKGAYLFSLLLLFALINIIYAQNELGYDEDELLRQAKPEAGIVFTMAEMGTGFGAFYALPFGNTFHVGAAIDVFFLRDSKEFEGIDYWGRYFSVNNVNNLYIFDAMITLKKRLFADDMHDSFRPFITGGFGPVYGLNSPESDNLPNQEEFSFGGFVGVGADISMDKKFFISIRGQYRVLPFSEPLGYGYDETSNHSMFELRLEIGKRL